jgi:hypothetical protein
MSIELTNEQAQAIATPGETPVLIDPRTKQAYRPVREEVFRKMQTLLDDDSPWTGDEKALLAGIAFSKLDDEDYSHYLRDPR